MGGVMGTRVLILSIVLCLLIIVPAYAESETDVSPLTRFWDFITNYFSFFEEPIEDVEIYTEEEVPVEPVDGDSCYDGDPCTFDDVYSNGVCAGTAYTCDAEEQCVQGVCNGNGGCIGVALVGEPCDDEDELTIGDTCDITGVCIGKLKEN